MDRLIIENVRCFRGRHEVPLAPLTILVGENSTGKSTLLAMARLAWDLIRGGSLNFNEEPFLLGAFEHIACSQAVRRGREASFTIGAVPGAARLSGPVRMEGRFTKYLGQPLLGSWLFETRGYKVEAEYGRGERVKSLRVITPEREEPVLSGNLFPRKMSFDWVSLILEEVGKGVDHLNFVQQLEALSSRIASGGRPYAFAPIRTRPQRTYDPIQEIANPEGGHVPMVLSGIHSRDPKTWKRLVEALARFGKTAGLFEEVDVRRLGDTEGDPFQLQIGIGGTATNLVDVGYGVSQILPILVECLRAEPERLFLLQQPEVHLHPRAQAELASFLALLVHDQRKRFLIETHSDYLVDRVRMDVRDQKHGLKPEDISILYLEREGGEVQIHRLELDDLGNIVNAPPGYRRFILEEERKFLGI